MPTPASTLPMRRHPDCQQDRCEVCLADHGALSDYLEAMISPGSARHTCWLEEYRKWLDKHAIPAETHGWASREACDTINIEAFIKEKKEEWNT